MANTIVELDDKGSKELKKDTKTKDENIVYTKVGLDDKAIKDMKKDTKTKRIILTIALWVIPIVNPLIVIASLPYIGGTIDAAGMSVAVVVEVLLILLASLSTFYTWFGVAQSMITRARDRAEKKNKKTPSTTEKSLPDIGNPLGLPEGTVRGFLIFMVGLPILLYLWKMATGSSAEIPTHLIVIFSVILAFYGLSSKDVLPKQLQVDIPSDFGSINRIAPLKKGIDTIVDGMEQLTNDLEVIKNFTDKNSQSLVTLKDRVLAKIDEYSALAKKFQIRGQSRWEQIGIIFLLVILIIISGLFIDQYQDNVGFNVIIGAGLGIVGIVSGLDVSSFLSGTLRDGVNLVFDDVLSALKEISSNIDDLKGKIDALKGKAQDLLKKNILSFAPMWIVSIIVVGLSGWASMLLLLVPGSNWSEALFIVLEVVVGFYFITKK